MTRLACTILMLVGFIPNTLANSLSQCQLLFIQEQYHDAFLECQKSVNSGDIKSESFLGLMYLEGQGVKENIHTGLKKLKTAADHNEPFAQYSLGIIYENGAYKITKNHSTAKQWYQKAISSAKQRIKAKDPNAYFVLGLMTLDGNELPPNVDDALALLLKASKLGHIAAQYILAQIYEYETDPKYKNYDSANRWYLKSAQGGNRLAFDHILQNCTQTSNAELAKSTFPVCLKLAQNGELKAQETLSDIYSNRFNLLDAYMWALKAARQGSQYSQTKMGDLLSSDLTDTGLNQNFREAFKWYNLAAEQGNRSAMKSIGDMYAEGKGVEINDEKALQWYRKGKSPISARNLCLQRFNKGDYKSALFVCSETDKSKEFSPFLQGNPLPPSIILARMYAKGLGVKQSYPKAINFYRKTLSFSTIRNYELGMLYLNASTDYRNYKKAAELFKMAAGESEIGPIVVSNREAAQAEFKSKYRLAIMFSEGIGVEQDFTQSRLWFQASIQNTSFGIKNLPLFSEAQFKLGEMYAKGQGMEKSGANAADLFYSAGLSYLKNGQREKALNCASRIKKLTKNYHLAVPNKFLADRLIEQIYEKKDK